MLVNKSKKRVNGKYKMMDLGPCKWLLGIKIKCDLKNYTTSLSQHVYIESILACFNFDNMKLLFLKNPGMAHWEAVKRIFWYLKGTKKMRLVYGDEEKDLQGWVDADEES